MIAQQYHPNNAALLALLSGASPARPPGTVCDHCGKTTAEASISSFKACGHYCHNARYCNAACSAADWPSHKAACRARKAELEASVQPRILPKPTHHVAVVLCKPSYDANMPSS